LGIQPKDIKQRRKQKNYSKLKNELATFVFISELILDSLSQKLMTVVQQKHFFHGNFSM